MKKLTIAVIKWIDACKMEDEVSPEDAESYPEGLELITAGILIKKTKKVIIIAFDIGSDEFYRDVATIPVTYIKSVQFFKIPANF